jgi:hypothetical protein
MAARSRSADRLSGEGAVPSDEGSSRDDVGIGYPLGVVSSDGESGEHQEMGIYCRLPSGSSMIHWPRSRRPCRRTTESVRPTSG